MTDQLPHIEPVNRTLDEAALGWRVSASFIKRARSHGLIRVIYMGDRPLIPNDEYERIAREGLPHVPSGYKRKTTGPTKAGRPRTAVKAEAQQRTKAARRGKSGQREQGASP